MNELLQQCAAIEQQHQALQNFAKSVAVLAALKAGRITLANVELVADGWRLIEDKPQQSPCIAVSLEEIEAAANEEAG